jgi:hypothetical protein
MKQLLAVLALTLALTTAASLPSGYQAPYTTDGSGPSAANLFGQFTRGEQVNLRYFIGGQGRLSMDFVPFTDGVGKDFALVTNGQAWSATGQARIEFYRCGKLVEHMHAQLTPDKTLEFELPGKHLVADRIVVSNTGTGDLTFDNAGVAYATTKRPCR